LESALKQRSQPFVQQLRFGIKLGTTFKTVTSWKSS
jgi:hypothetical protein